MQHINIRNSFVIAIVFLLMSPALRAQTIGDRSDLINKTWRILAMKCPESMQTSDSDQFVHYYASLKMVPTSYQNMNYGTYVMVNRDESDNPMQKGTYAFKTDDFNGTQIILTPERGGTPIVYRVQMVFPHHLTLINLGDDVQCRVSYAIAP